MKLFHAVLCMHAVKYDLASLLHYYTIFPIAHSLRYFNQYRIVHAVMFCTLKQSILFALSGYHIFALSGYHA